jgi:molybdopterin converting factor small subunit
MTIHVQLYGHLRDALPLVQKGKASIDLPERSTVTEVLEHFDIQADVLTAVNDEQASAAGTILQDGDRVFVFPPVAGG